MRRVVALLVLTLGICLGQLSVSTIRGTVTDPTGSVIPGATITLVNVATNIERSAKTSENGDFEMPDLQSGTYRLGAAHPGFKSFSADNIIVERNQVRRIDVTLELGQVGTEVSVKANAAVIETDTAKLQSSFSNKRFDDAPWIGDGRNPQVVLTTQPLVQSSGGIYNIQIAGQPSSQAQTGIDGHAGDGTSLQGVSVHFVQEVVTVAGNNSAEFSRIGYYNMITKSGTNQFHGRASYWHQNSALSARNFFDTTKPKNLFHTWSGEMMGPVRRNRTFFYGSYSGQLWPSSTFYLRDVPTQKMRQGDFSELLSLSRPVTVRDPLTGNPFAGNIIPSTRFNATSVKLADKYMPAPTVPGALANNFGFLFPYPSDAWHMNNLTGRIDHKLSDKNTIYGRVIYSLVDYVLAGNYPDLAWTRLRDSRHYVIEDTHIFSPGLVNTARFALYHFQVRDGDEVGGFTPARGDEVVRDLGLQGVNPQGLSAMGFPRVDITGYSTIRVNPGGLVQNDKTWGFANTTTLATGRHVLRFGGEYRPQSNFNGSVPEGTYGIFNFNGSYTGYGYSDFLLGLPFSSQRQDPITNRTQTDYELGLFIQDTFKISQRLNLEPGLRWDRFGSANYTDGLIYNWDPVSANVIVPEQALNKVSPLYPANIKVVGGDARPHPSNKNFVPRIGVAWRPFGQTFVVRGGYGIYTETIGRFARAQGVGPFSLSETFFNSVQNSTPLFAFPNPFPAGSGTIASQTVTGFPSDTSNGKIHQFNLTVERQIKDIGIRGSYLGSRSRGLNYSLQINKPQPSLIPFTASRRPYAQFAGASYWRTDGASNFNAFTLEVQRKVGQVTFDGHWTWASNYNNILNLENPYAPLFWNRDPSTSRHRAVINAIWEVPVGRGRRLLSSAPAVVDHVLGGWQLYWIAYMETGQFFSPSYSGADPSNTNTSGGLPDRVANGNLPPGERQLNRWFDPNAFVRPPAGRFGNSGVNILEGPGLHEHNLTVSKRFRMTERFSFTLMAAVQNLLNHANFNNPSANISAPASVGVVNSVRPFAPARQIMLRGRIDF
jgi:hypothetical protein